MSPDVPAASDAADERKARKPRGPSRKPAAGRPAARAPGGSDEPPEVPAASGAPEEIAVPGDDGVAGAPARARRLAGGIAARLAKVEGLVVTEEEKGHVVKFEGRVAARLLFGHGVVDVHVDPRAGVGAPLKLRRIGSPHPDRRLSAEGWRRMVVRTSRDASRVVDALRRPKAKSTGDDLAPGRHRGPRTDLLVGRVRVRRLRDPVRADDGARVYVDETWPRGVDREAVEVSDWVPGVAPSKPLRQAYGEVPARVRGFRRRYLSELKGTAKAELVTRLRYLSREGPITLLTDVRDVSLSHAAVLADALSHGRTPRA